MSEETLLNEETLPICVGCEKEIHPDEEGHNVIDGHDLCDACFFDW